MGLAGQGCGEWGWLKFRGEEMGIGIDIGSTISMLVEFGLQVCRGGRRAV